MVSSTGLNHLISFYKKVQVHFGQNTIDNGIQNPGDWDGNALSVNEIYTENYSNFSTEKPQAGTQGYAFYDNDGDGSYDHMYYYDYRNGGSSYHVWNSNGIDSVSESDWSINGTAVRNSVYVPLN